MPKSHCVKKVRIQNFSGPYFPAFGLIRIRKTSNTDTFHAVSISNFNYKSSVMRQKRKSQNRCFKKTRHAKFSEKQAFLTAWNEEQNVRFSENLGNFCFLEIPVLRFTLLSYYRRSKKSLLKVHVQQTLVQTI